MLLTTIPSERIGHYTRMRRFFVRFNRSESFVHTRSSVGFTIITSGFEFSVHTSKAFFLTIDSELGRGFINRRISITALAHEFPQPLSRYVGKSSQAAVLMIMPILDLAMK